MLNSEISNELQLVECQDLLVNFEFRMNRRKKEKFAEFMDELKKQYSDIIIGYYTAERIKHSLETGMVVEYSPTIEVTVKIQINKITNSRSDLYYISDRVSRIIEKIEPYAYFKANKEISTMIYFRKDAGIIDDDFLKYYTHKSGYIRHLNQEQYSKIDYNYSQSFQIYGSSIKFEIEGAILKKISADAVMEHFVDEITSFNDNFISKIKVI